MNIYVVIPKSFAGCGFYRLYQPHNHLAKNYNVNVTLGSGFQKTEISAFTDEELREFDIIIWHKTLFDLADIKRARDLGITTIADFDDHWVVNREHTLYKEYLKEGLPARLHKLLLAVDYVTCTTETLADEIYKHNKNVVVLPNAVDRGYEGWKNERIKEDKYTFGYLGGPCHTRDVALLRGVQESLSGEFMFRLFGFNGTDIYNHYADILSGGKASDNFSLYKGADIFNYPQFYNYMDCSLVPLEANSFNRMKSELKLIEAGAFAKAVIVSGVEPYTDIARHEKNCLIANSKQDWIDSCKRLIKDNSLGRALGRQLEEDTADYDISVVNKKRYKFYKNVQSNSNKSSRTRLSGVEHI